MKQLFYLSMLFVMVVMGSCDPEEEPVVTFGMSPVYSDVQDFSFIKSEAPRDIVSLGIIVNVGNTIYLCEVGSGIHVIDNADPGNPIFTNFLVIPGIRTFTLQDNTLYADYFNDLLVIDISDINNISVVDVLEDVYEGSPNTFQFRPPFDYDGPFECVRPDEGFVVDWQRKLLTDPTCSTL